MTREYVNDRTLARLGITSDQEREKWERLHLLMQVFEEMPPDHGADMHCSLQDGNLADHFLDSELANTEASGQPAVKVFARAIVAELKTWTLEQRRLWWERRFPYG